MAPDELAQRVAASTALSSVPLKLEDQQTANVIAEALRPHAQRPKHRQEAA